MGDKVPYSLYGPNARRYFLYYLLHMATPIAMVTQKDLAVATWVTRKSLIASVGETVTVLSLCLDPINMNSVSMNSKSALDETKLAQNKF